MHHRLWLISLFVLATVSVAAPARAAMTDPLIEGAKLCTRHLPRYEREYAIPTHLLSAIASTESGRYHEGLNIKVPWPWTINAEGKGYFFDSKDQAIAAVRRLRAQGVQSIDVGCMQVNLFHHPEAFSSLDRAFDPETNIAYAASFLRSLYQEDGSWKKAAADYHSKTPALGSQYVGQVYNSWYQIIDKLRAARLQVPATEMAAADNLNSPHVIEANALPRAATPVKSTKAAVYQHPHMNSIQLSHADSQREGGIIVVRPETASVSQAQAIPVAADASSLYSPIAVAQAREVAPLPDAHVIHVDSRVVASPGGDSKTGPNFIFND